jgi:hypothetical protein
VILQHAKKWLVWRRLASVLHACVCWIARAESQCTLLDVAVIPRHVHGCGVNISSGTAQNC